MNASERFTEWIEHAHDPEVASELLSLQDSGDDSAIEDAFFQELSFGTAGLRGIIGAGTNRMNIYTVGRATLGLADYLNATCDAPSVAIARDSRNNGELFVRIAASVLARNGIRVFVFPRIEPVPALSFAVRDLSASAGIVMTASHNPAAYNGYKVYGSDGCQIAEEDARAVSDAIAAHSYFDYDYLDEFDHFVEQGAISLIDDSLLDRFIDAELACLVPDEEAAATPLKLVYTPLNGSGLELNGRMFSELGISDVTVVPEQRDPDGNFPTCPYPNPEVREALELGLSLCEQVHPDLLLATDPDADRVGIAVKDGDGYSLLTGNEVGVLMFDYLCRALTAQGAMPSNPVAISTIVSTPMIDAVAQKYGVKVLRTLTGFKYIGAIVSDLVDNGHPEDFILGFEESYGYLAATHVRDKDSVSASMVICRMAQSAKAKGMSLSQAMDALYDEYGYYRARTVNASFPGAQGAEKMATVMRSLREQTPHRMAGLTVEHALDYACGNTGLPAADVIELQLQDGCKLVFRPSGTEPKIKAYAFARADNATAADKLIDKLANAALEMFS